MPPTPRIDITPAQEALAPVEPCTLVIFGGSGDLARRRLIPALYNLMLDGLLPANFAVLGLGRKSMTDEDFRTTLREGVLTHSRQPLKEDRWSVFAERLFYLAGGNEDRQTYTALKARVEDIERQFGLPGNRIFYLSIPPSSFTAVCEGLEYSELAVHRDRPYARIIVEKPVGRDLSSAQQINAVTGRVFDESQIFRIDHYLGKETVQNLMVVRFANSIFEPIWNHKYIDHVQITVSEAEGVGTRATYYEEAGALRDMVQNHMLQLLCLVAMEPPYSLDPDVVRNAKMEVLRCLRPITGKDVETFTVRAQYAAGRRGGEPGTWLPPRTGSEARLNHGNLCRPQMFRRELALVRRAVLSAHRQDPATSGQRSRGPIQGHSADFVQRQPSASAARQCPGPAHPTGRRLVVAHRLASPGHQRANPSGGDGL